MTSTHGPAAQAGYDTKLERIPVRGADDLIIRSLLDNQQFADPDGQAAAAGLSAATWSLFGVLWPSSRQLAAHMAGRRLLAGERILEVGCGLALASLVCHRRGIDVTASDCHPLALSFLAHNTQLNGLSPLAYRHGNWGADPLPAQAEGAPAAGEALGRFDVIMGSDVLYERDDRGRLAAFVQRHAMPQAEVLIVDPNRSNRSAFTRRMAAQGFTLRQTMLCEPPDNGSAAYRGRLMQYSRVL